MTRLRAAFAELNDAQREAVCQEDHTVVLAGPGSGKTATLAVKVAHLLADVVPGSRGVACVTYNNDAVREVTSRLGVLGIRPGRSVFVGTVHSFCLNAVLRPYARLAPEIARPDRTVLAGHRRADLVAAALTREGSNDRVSWFEPRLQSIRRAQALAESVERFDPLDVRVAARYSALLAECNAVDFDGMVLDALSLLRSVAVVREVLAARYAWLAVDEYQDLGGPLHAIVECLAAAGTKIFAVGDPDQTLYGFTGADPRYLQRLLDDDAFHEVRLRFNYRAGSRLIAASQAALAPERDHDYRADPERKDPGDIDIRLVEGGLVAQARVVAREIIPALTARDIPEHEIAVLYPSASPIYDALSQELQSADLPVLAERDSPYPSALAVRLLQQIAHRGLEGAGRTSRRSAICCGRTGDTHARPMPSSTRAMSCASESRCSTLALIRLIPNVDSTTGCGRRSSGWLCGKCLNAAATGRTRSRHSRTCLASPGTTSFA